MTTASSPLTSSGGLSLSETRIEGPIWLSKDDVSFIKTRISDAESRIRALELQIHALELQRDAELNKVPILRNILSPIRRIPAETLSEIFEYACFDTGSRNKGAVRISSVCAAWKNTAHGTPSLWTKIRYVERLDTSKRRREMEMVNTWFGRSGGLPLQLDMDMFQGRSRANSAAQLLHFLPRASSLRLWGHLELFLPMLLLPPGSLPLLNSLVLNLIWPLIPEDTQRQPYPVPRGLAVFSGSPLETISITDFEREPNSWLDVVTLDDVQLIRSLDLDLHNEESQLINARAYLTFMSKLTNLVTLRIRFRCGLSHNLETVFLHLPCLTSIHLSSTTDTAAGHIFHVIGGLVAPRLTSVSLLFYGDYCPSDLLQALRAFQDRSSVSLYHLELSGVGADHRDVSDIIDVFAPTIRKLRLVDIWFDPTLLLHDLTYHEGEQVSLPGLQDFHLKFNSEVNEFSDFVELSSVIADMIVSRWYMEKGDSTVMDSTGGDAKLPARLSHVSMNLNKLPFTGEALRRLDACKEQGLDVVVENYELLEEEEDEDEEEEEQEEEE